MQAVFSPCGTYRHMLREDGRHLCAWVMLNPSVAGSVDAAGKVRDDPTANKVRQFSKDWGYDGFVIVNVYDKVSTDPRGLWTGAPARSPDNDAYLMAAASLPLVVMACGAHAKPEDVIRTRDILQRGCPQLFCLSITANGNPGHPLYLPYSSRLRPWPLAY